MVPKSISVPSINGAIAVRLFRTNDCCGGYCGGQMCEPVRWRVDRIRASLAGYLIAMALRIMPGRGEYRLEIEWKK